MKKMILSTLVALILMFSAYAVAVENDDATLSLSSVSIEDGVSGRMQAKAQQIYYATSQQFFNSNMAQRLGFSQMQSAQNMQTPQSTLTPQNNMQNQKQNPQTMRQQGQ